MLNLALMKHWENWVTVFLMVAFALLLVSLLFPPSSTSSEG